jgi:hypothetical protein
MQIMYMKVAIVNYTEQKLEEQITKHEKEEKQNLFE